MICWGWEETTAHDKMSLVCNGALCGVQHVGQDAVQQGGEMHKSFYQV